MRILSLVALLLCAGCHAPARSHPEAAGTAVSTFLMFQDGNAEEAMTLYTSVFPGARIVQVERYGPGEMGLEGSVKVARLDLRGHRLMFSDSPVEHGFAFTPSTSLFVDFGSVEELESAFATLSAGGAVFMPLDDYGFSRRFGWCSDRFGIAWQLNLPEVSESVR